MIQDPVIAIAIPLATPMIYWRTVSALLEMERPCETRLMVFQGALVDRARNFLVEKMLEDDEMTHLFFLDADIVPPTDTLIQLLAAQKPVVSGLYRKRLPPYEPMAFIDNKRSGQFEPISFPKKSGKKNSLKKVDLVGAGCLLIERRVLESVQPPWFESQWTKKGRRLSHLAEDFFFCQKIRKAGFEIFVDTSIHPLHLEPLGVSTSGTGEVEFVPMEPFT